jgi:hypothetical protein
MTELNPFPDPYQEAVTWIEQHPGTSSAAALAKLILSLWNTQCCYSFRECVTGLDTMREAMALRIVVHFQRTGEDHHLRAAGETVCAAYPDLWDVAVAGDDAKEAEIARRRSADEQVRERFALDAQA